MAARRTGVQLAHTVWPYTLIPLGDRALTVDVSAANGPPSRVLVRSIAARLAGEALAGVVAIVPAIQSLTLHYDPRRTDFGALRDAIGTIMATLALTAEPDVEPIIIPVCYGGEYGPDLDDVAAAHQTTPAAVIAAHTDGLYTVAMIGFLPGFPYLEGLAPALHTPRRATPRTAVPAGSVGIGGSSTGVCPFTSPGGWHIIGRTPRVLFSPTSARPSLLQAGDRVRFAAITEASLRMLMATP
jgi:inhibitor of KinA